ncbi:DUF1800 domain-containing protein [Catenovulum agarivorans]|uniref:DUF1800 domain-containing protein n=1 Tax=Catenovulum agarivorans TaxID=1172192 RepID=UPI0002FF5B8C|nr:DUF1800 domain-containing protein [Catenovulum agarivorans]
MPRLHSKYIAYNRFGYGINPTETSSITDAQSWLTAQLKPVKLDETIWNTELAYQYYKNYRLQKQAEKEARANKKRNVEQTQTMQMQDDGNALKKRFNRQAKLATYLSAKYAIETNNGLQAQLLDFFSNHFSVTSNGFAMRALAPLLEIEAIGPNLTGKFADLLLAVESHPAMLIYLNNEQSIGPDSAFAKKRKNKGLNENLAREILELHTLGVDGGYSQQDVIELAKAITGWSVANPLKEDEQGFVYRDKAHQPGNRTVLGKTYKQKGMEQGKAILQDLANHPSCIHFVCTKLVRHFIADEADLTIVEEMKKAWQKSQGDIKTVMTALINHPNSWQPKQQKFKTPREFLISSYRLGNVPFEGKYQKAFINMLEMMGQQPFSAGSPAGYKTERNAWDGPDAILNRIDWANEYAKQVKQDPLALAKAAIGESLSDKTYLFLSRAESRQQALAMLLMSPEFQFK